MRDALTPSLACAAAHLGDLEALQALAEQVSPSPCRGPGWPFWGSLAPPCQGYQLAASGSDGEPSGCVWGLTPVHPPLLSLPRGPRPIQPSSAGDVSFRHPGQ